MNLRRLVGIRECFIPRPGKVFAQADYPTLELRTLAQACYDLLGKSRLGDMINAGSDPHLAFGAEMLGLSYDDAKKIHKNKNHPRYKEVDDARQVGKVFNFGRPGGLGASRKKDGTEPTLCTFARKTYGIELTVEQVTKYGQAWFATFPEMRDYFDHVGKLTDNPKKEARVTQLRSGRIRGGCTYTAACNTYFQGLGADAAKAAGYAITKACYVDRKSPLFGSRLVAMIHDEFIIETADNDQAHDAAFEMSRIMREEANRWVPDCPFVDIEPQLMRLWSKDAEALYHPETKRLVPWEPELAGCIKLGEAVKARSLAVSA
jgi:predicted small secreted protein